MTWVDGNILVATFDIALHVAKIVIKTKRSHGLLTILSFKLSQSARRRHRQGFAKCMASQPYVDGMSKLALLDRTHAMQLI